MPPSRWGPPKPLEKTNLRLVRPVRAASVEASRTSPGWNMGPSGSLSSSSFLGTSLGALISLRLSDLRPVRQLSTLMLVPSVTATGPSSCSDVSMVRRASTPVLKLSTSLRPWMSRAVSLGKPGTVSAGPLSVRSHGHRDSFNVFTSPKQPRSLKVINAMYVVAERVAHATTVILGIHDRSRTNVLGRSLLGVLSSKSLAMRCNCPSSSWSSDMLSSTASLAAVQEMRKFLNEPGVSNW
mmetsp:Transcript_12495/g.30692  ORF Transcript_12495/g.30692 Transcript_12495/m.30692 type:complete len:239 (-) Transcript_12495:86-802(-)